MGTDRPAGLWNYDTMIVIANEVAKNSMFQDDTSTLFSGKVEMWNWTTKTQLMNMANSDAHVTAHKIQARQDLPDAGSTRNPIATLGQGYAAAEINAGAPTLGNLGLVDDVFDVWDSPYFLSLWKVLETKKFLLKPGRTKTMYLSSKQRKNINITRLVRWTAAGENIGTAARVLSQQKGMTMWIYKVAGTLGRASATATPGWTTPEVILAAQTHLNYNPMTIKIRSVQGEMEGFGSGTVSVREPYDMDYKTNTIAT